MNCKASLWRQALTCAVLTFAMNVPARAQAPTGLTVKTATKAQVSLSWNGSASSYTVQRAQAGGSYATIGTASTAAYTDSTINPYTTYQYQVLSGTAASGSVVVGPPPAGVSNVAPAPIIGATPSTTYGYNLAMTLDGNGDPAFVFLWDDPNNDGDHSDTQLLFRSWNRAQYSWNPVVKIATVGDVATTGHSVASVAYDASTNTFAGASERAPAAGSHVVDLFVSSNGATWTLKNTFSGDGYAVGPSLALARGNLYLAFEIDGAGLSYVTGQLNQSPTTWTTRTPQKAAGTDLANWRTGPSLALDSAGNPGIAYWADPADGAEHGALLFWRANASAPVKITNGDGTAVKLTYDNLNPRVAMWVQLNDGDWGQGVHFAHSENGGNSWPAPVLVPPDGNSSSDYPFDLAIDSRGNAAVGFGQNGNAGDDSHKCGNPKISRSSDLVHFSTCSFAGLSVTQNFSVFPAGLQVGFGGNDKLYVLWLESSDTQANTGVLMYREPPSNELTGPSISSVVDGASFRPNIVPGSWVTIRGANLSATTRTWNDSDFKNGSSLPTTLDGVSVKINGLPAPVYYVSQGQLNVQAPSPISGPVSVQVTFNNATSNNGTANAVTSAPALFAYVAGTKTYPAAVFPNGLIVGDPSLSGSVVSMARPGDVIQFYATGLAASPAGTIVTSVIVDHDAVTATIGGKNALVQFAGLVASGEFQINIVVPNLPPGEYPVTLTTNGQSSQTGVVVPIQ